LWYAAHALLLPQLAFAHVTPASAAWLLDSDEPMFDNFALARPAQ
jgi:hypothetical protein